MKIRFCNNTSFKTLEPQILIDSVKHLLITTDKQLIESIVLYDDKLVVFGEDCLLLEHNLKKPMKVSGKIRWFNESSGDGSIRLDSGVSVHFFSCNVVGANSGYPKLVSNIQFNEGDSVSAEISNDEYLFNSLGLTNVRKAA